MKLSLHTKILLGLVVGAIVGVIVNMLSHSYPSMVPWVDGIIHYVTGPLGQIFLRLLFMTVVPLVLATLTVGVAHMGNMKKLGRVGVKTFSFFLMITIIATIVGLLLVNTFKPGTGFDRTTQQKLLQTYQGHMNEKTRVFHERGGFGVQTFVNIIPRNPFSAMVNMDMLAVIFFALMLGVALARMKPNRAKPLLGVMDSISDAMITIVGFAMQLAPYAVPALIFNVTAKFGAGLLEKLSYYMIVVFAGYLIHLFIVYSILVRTAGGMNPVTFYKKAASVMVTAFSTSSSNATLPTTMKVTEEEMGVPGDIAGFVLPLGATMNMNGTALYEGVTVLFLAQVFGMHLGLAQQIIVVALSVMMAVGTAGIPGGSIPMIMIVLATVHVPPESIAIILGIDRLLDMGRTTLNVTGDMTTAIYVARSEHQLRS